MPRPNAAVFSESFGDFVSEACTRDYKARPSAAMLLRHPFVAHLDSERVCAATTYRPTDSSENDSELETHSARRGPPPATSGHGNGRARPAGAAASGTVMAGTASSAARTRATRTRARGSAATAMSGNTRNYASMSSVRAAASRGPAGRESEALLLPSLTKQQLPTGHRSDPDLAGPGLGQESSGASYMTAADIRKLVKYWKAYIVQLKRFNATTPSVLKTTRATQPAQAQAQVPLTYPRFKTPRNGYSNSNNSNSNGPRSDSSRSVPNSARGGGEPLAALVKMELDSRTVDSLAESLRCDRELLRTAFDTAIADIRQEFVKDLPAEVAPGPAALTSPAPPPAAVAAPSTAHSAVHSVSEKRVRMQHSKSEVKKSAGYRRSTLGSEEVASLLPSLSAPPKPVTLFDDGPTAAAAPALSLPSPSGRRTRPHSQALLPLDPAALPLLELQLQHAPISIPANLGSRKQSFRYSVIPSAKNLPSRSASGSFSDDETFTGSHRRARAGSVSLNCTPRKASLESESLSPFASQHGNGKEASRSSTVASGLTLDGSPDDRIAMNMVLYTPRLDLDDDQGEQLFLQRDYASDTALERTHSRLRLLDLASKDEVPPSQLQSRSQLQADAMETCRTDAGDDAFRSLVSSSSHRRKTRDRNRYRNEGEGVEVVGRDSPPGEWQFDHLGEVKREDLQASDGEGSAICGDIDDNEDDEEDDEFMVYCSSSDLPLLSSSSDTTGAAEAGTAGSSILLRSRGID